MLYRCANILYEHFTSGTIFHTPYLRLECATSLQTAKHPHSEVRNIHGGVDDEANCVVLIMLILSNLSYSTYELYLRIYFLDERDRFM